MKVIWRINEIEEKEYDGYADELTTQWAEIETYKSGELERVKELMEDLVKRNGRSTTNWINYIKFIRHLGDYKLVRTLFRRGVEFSDSPDALGNIWLDWEAK